MSFDHQKIAQIFSPDFGLQTDYLSHQRLIELDQSCSSSASPIAHVTLPITRLLLFPIVDNHAHSPRPILVLNMRLILIFSSRKIWMIFPTRIIGVIIVLMSSSTLSISYKVKRIWVCPTYLCIVVTTSIDLTLFRWLLYCINLYLLSS